MNRSTLACSEHNWFDQGGEAYAAFRPHYPDALCNFLASLVSERCSALDVGCGSGQLSFDLARYFDCVIGLDPSAEQIHHAEATYRNLVRDVFNEPAVAEHGARHVTFIQSAAESIPCADNSVDLITAAQAAHWFDLTTFYREVKRVGKHGGILALISYGVLRLDDALDESFSSFYWRDLQAYWPPERRLVDEGYRALDFPFEEITAPEMTIQCTWDLPAFLGYLSTWSAVRNANQQGHTDILMRFTKEIETLWGLPDKKRLIQWPLALRVGRLQAAA